MNELVIDCFIETQYYQAKKNNEPIDVTEFNMAFATNPYYMSGSPIARHGPADIMVDFSSRSDIDYSSDFAKDLIETDRYLVTDRVAFFSLMRAYLPSFSLVCHSGNEYKVKSFATFYKDGFFSVTNIYSSLKLSINRESLEEIYYWKNIDYIKLDPLTTQLLKIELHDFQAEQLDAVEALCIPINEFWEHFSGDKFAVGKETILQVLTKFEESSDSSNNRAADFVVFNCIQPFSYLGLRCNYKLKRINTERIANILYGREDNDFVNESLCDMGRDLTAAPNSITRGYRKFLYSIQKTESEVHPEKLLMMFCLFDACIIEKIKYLCAIRNIRNLVYYPDMSSADIHRLVDLRDHQISTVNDGYVYEYRDDLSLTVKTIRECLGIEDYKKEYEHFCHIAEEKIVTDRELHSKEEKERQNEEKGRQNKVLNLVILILTIPSVTILVDAFYGLEIDPPFNIPILSLNVTKIIWCLIALLCSFCIVYKHSIRIAVVNLFKKSKHEDDNKSIVVVSNNDEQSDNAPPKG